MAGDVSPVAMFFIETAHCAQLNLTFLPLCYTSNLPSLSWAIQAGIGGAAAQKTKAGHYEVEVACYLEGKP